MSAYPQTQVLEALSHYLEHSPLPEELWVFAYGSLMWNPEMQVIETKQGKVHGFQRGFNLLSTVHRGTIDKPGLVLSLRHGGHCEGLAFRIAQNTKHEDFKQLWLREMVTLFYRPRVCQVITNTGVINAITFIADQEHEQYVDFDAAQCASMIGQAHGGRGSNMDYFNNTSSQLKQLKIDDPLFNEISAHWTV
ncbi:MAG: gamma-glutamylcyclotransferase [Gammaproteobacteria bacterium]|nr:gamma-glutamylcyclotransferase [Gammaproteobacteria bacterium]